jgi:hypothetical protein
MFAGIEELIHDRLAARGKAIVARTPWRGRFEARRDHLTLHRPLASSWLRVSIRRRFSDALSGQRRTA